jgi:hypothetical protein
MRAAQNNPNILSAAVNFSELPKITPIYFRRPLISAVTLWQPKITYFRWSERDHRK